MYSFFIALYMGMSVYQIYQKLIAVEGGFAGFSRLNWVMFVLAVLMVPFTVLMCIKSYRDIKADAAKKKQEAEERSRIEEQRRQEKFEDISADAADEAAPASPPADGRQPEGSSRFDA